MVVLSPGKPIFVGNTVPPVTLDSVVTGPLPRTVGESSGSISEFTAVTCSHPSSSQVILHGGLSRAIGLVVELLLSLAVFFWVWGVPPVVGSRVRGASEEDGKGMVDTRVVVEEWVSVVVSSSWSSSSGPCAGGFRSGLGVGLGLGSPASLLGLGGVAEESLTSNFFSHSEGERF